MEVWEKSKINNKSENKSGCVEILHFVQIPIIIPTASKLLSLPSLRLVNIFKILVEFF